MIMLRGIIFFIITRRMEVRSSMYEVRPEEVRFFDPKGSMGFACDGDCPTSISPVM